MAVLPIDLLSDADVEPGVAAWSPDLLSDADETFALDTEFLPIFPVTTSLYLGRARRFVRRDDSWVRVH